MNASTPRVMDLPVARHGDHDRRGDRDALCIEAPLEILINGAPFSVTMRSPGDELELARGLLFTEGVLPSSAPYPYTSEACHRGPWPRKLDLSVREEELTDHLVHGVVPADVLGERQRLALRVKGGGGVGASRAIKRELLGAHLALHGQHPVRSERSRLAPQVSHIGHRVLERAQAGLSAQPA